MKFKNLAEAIRTFEDENYCRQYLIEQRWNGKPVCPYCGIDKAPYVIEGGKRFKCSDKDCHKKFSVTVGTVFENTNVKLSVWFPAIYLITAHKKGISSCQLARDLGVTQKTAWFILYRIREMLKVDAPGMLKGSIEIDESYFGGKEKNKHKGKRVKKPESHVGAHGRSNTVKTPVLGLVQRGGNAFAKKVYAADHTFLLPVIYTKVEPGATVYTDSWPSYTMLGANYDHYTIDHSTGKYANGLIHTNTIEGFWSLFKRGIIGIYHFASYKHLNAYCNEFAYRYNTRKVTDAQRFEASLSRAEGKRIKYKDLTHKFYKES